MMDNQSQLNHWINLKRKKMEILTIKVNNKVKNLNWNRTMTKTSRNQEHMLMTTMKMIHEIVKTPHLKINSKKVPKLAIYL